MITTTTTTASAVHYASVEDLELWLGELNVDIFSNAAGATARNADRVEAALSQADREINETLRASGFETPLSSGHPAFGDMSDVAKGLAAYELFAARPSRDPQGEPSNEVATANTWRRRAIDKLNRIAMTGLGTADRLAESPTYPTAVD